MYWTGSSSNLTFLTKKRFDKTEHNSIKAIPSPFTCEILPTPRTWIASVTIHSFCNCYLFLNWIHVDISSKITGNEILDLESSLGYLDKITRNLTICSKLSKHWHTVYKNGISIQLSTYVCLCRQSNINGSQVLEHFCCEQKVR